MILMEEKFLNHLLNNWASLMAQTVKDLPAVLETQVQSLGWEDPLDAGQAGRL